MSVKVRDEVLPSPAAQLLQLARLQAGISQQELAEHVVVVVVRLEVHRFAALDPPRPSNRASKRAPKR